MKKIAFVIPWFGKLPNYFQLWLESCKRNPTIDFLVFTDQQPEYSIPENIKLFQYTFKEMVYRFEKKLGIPVALNSPYKLCDFKPSYGEVFEDYLNDYDYWGHCDVDLIWGDIRKFVTDELLEKYVRIFSRGHCSIYRNSSEVNAMYRLLPSNGKLNWKEVFQSPNSFCFDEWAGHCGGGYSSILIENGIDIYDEPVMADLAVMKGYFRINNRDDIRSKDVFFEYENGSLFLKNGYSKVEFMYCHFQKRKVDIENSIDFTKYYFVAPRYVTSRSEKIRRHLLDEFAYEMEKNVMRGISKVKQIRRELLK